VIARNVLTATIMRLPTNGHVLDIGCLGLDLYRLCKTIRPDLNISGCDLIDSQDIPADMTFRRCDLETEALPFQDDQFHLVVCSHVFEHIRNPVDVYGEIVRVTTPGGRLYIEAPSDRSTHFSLPILQGWHHILSFYDDPTHLGRPWTPQALHRMAIYWGATPEIARYEWSFLHCVTLLPAMLFYLATRNVDALVSHWWKGTGWSCFSVAQKPETLTGPSRFTYFSFKGMPADTP
jgi:SAM-dependent methyltransferase